MREIDSVANGESVRHSFGPIRLEKLMREMLSEEGEDGVGSEGTRLELLADEKPDENKRL